MKRDIVAILSAEYGPFKRSVSYPQCRRWSLIGQAALKNRISKSAGLAARPDMDNNCVELSLIVGVKYIRNHFKSTH
jgi:hypothetical protein